MYVCTLRFVCVVVCEPCVCPCKEYILRFIFEKNTHAFILCMCALCGSFVLLYVILVCCWCEWSVCIVNCNSTNVVSFSYVSARLWNDEMKNTFA